METERIGYKSRSNGLYITSKLSHYLDARIRMGNTFSIKAYFTQIAKGFFISKAAKDKKEKNDKTTK